MPGVDIFCRVVDNFGDMGVCWRLARRLGLDHGWQVRLWIDDLARFQRLAPDIDPSSCTQDLDGIELRAWSTGDAIPLDFRCHDLVIEAFACDPPAWFIQAMRTRTPPPLWINLEYLSAEPWVEGCHGLPSMRSDGLKKYFFFPGWTAGTGGLLREPGRTAAVAQAQASEARRIDSLHGIGLHALGDALADEHTRLVSVFCYPHAPIAALLQSIARHWHTQRTWVCLAGDAQPDLDLCTLPNIRMVRLPMLSHEHYDVLLQSCDLNVVRGEDSLVRAIWAARPFLWHIYPQDEQAHLAKLDAWLARASLPETVKALQRAFNAVDGAPLSAARVTDSAARLTDSPSRVTDNLSLLTDSPARVSLEASAALALASDWPIWQEAARQDGAALATQTDLADNIVAFFTSHAFSR